MERRRSIRKERGVREEYNRRSGKEKEGIVEEGIVFVACCQKLRADSMQL